MFLEQIDTPHIAAQRVEAPVTAYFAELPDARAALRGRGEEPAAQAVAGIGGGSSPTRRAYRFTIRAALSSARASHDTRPPRVTARNTGPLLISAAASHACTASTGRSL